MLLITVWSGMWPVHLWTGNSSNLVLIKITTAVWAVRAEGRRGLSLPAAFSFDHKMFLWEQSARGKWTGESGVSVRWEEIFFSFNRAIGGGIIEIMAMWNNWSFKCEWLLENRREHKLGQFFSKCSTCNNCWPRVLSVYYYPKSLTVPDILYLSGAYKQREGWITLVSETEDRNVTTWAKKNPNSLMPKSS